MKQWNQSRQKTVFYTVQKLSGHIVTLLCHKHTKASSSVVLFGDEAFVTLKQYFVVLVLLFYHCYYNGSFWGP